MSYIPFLFFLKKVISFFFLVYVLHSQNFLFIQKTTVNLSSDPANSMQKLKQIKFEVNVPSIKLQIMVE